MTTAIKKADIVAAVARGDLEFLLRPEVQRARRDLDPSYVSCPVCNRSTAGCPHCHFSGSVKAGSTDATCVHDWKNLGSVGKCLTSFQCIKCGTIHTIDSSD